MSWKEVAYADEVASLSDTAPQDVTKEAAAAGSGPAASRDDHKHDVSVGAPVAITENASQAEGTATSLARSDHEHASPATWDPSAHAADHKSAGGDPILLNELGDPTGSINFNQQEALAFIPEKATGSLGSGVDGQVKFFVDDDHIYVYVA